MRGSVRRDPRFWVRVFLTGVIIDIPLTWAVVSGAVRARIALPLMLVLGLMLVVLWDGASRPAPDELTRSPA